MSKTDNIIKLYEPSSKGNDSERDPPGARGNGPKMSSPQTANGHVSKGRECFFRS